MEDVKKDKENRRCLYNNNTLCVGSLLCNSLNHFYLSFF